MIKTDTLTYNKQQTVSDYPFKAQFDWVLGTATASTHDANIHEIWNRVNHNYCGLIECIRKESVEKTINAYVNLINAYKQAPIYNYYYVEKQPRKEYVEIVTTISNKTGVKVDEVKKILKQLQFADKDGSITKGTLNPRTIDKSITKTPDNADSYKNKLDPEKYLKYGLLAVGALVAVKAVSLID